MTQLGWFGAQRTEANGRGLGWFSRSAQPVDEATVVEVAVMHELPTATEAPAATAHPQPLEVDEADVSRGTSTSGSVIESTPGVAEVASPSLVRRSKHRRW